MAGSLSLQDQNLVWLKVKQALNNANPAAQSAFLQLREYMSQQLKGIQLQYIPFGEADIDAATGFIPGASGIGAHTLYGIWAKKSNTGSTLSFLTVYDANTNTGAGLQKGPTLGFKTSGDQHFAVSPTGWLFTNASGPTVASVTTVAGGTATTGDADSVHGFLIVGA